MTFQNPNSHYRSAIMILLYFMIYF